MTNLFKRCFAYIFDVYFITVLHIIVFSLIRLSLTGEFRLSLLYVLKNYGIILISAYLFYFLFCEYFYGQTLGKKIFRLRVVSEKHTFVSFLIRTISRLIPVDFVFILFTKNRFLHDILSKTNVVDNKKVEDEIEKK